MTDSTKALPRAVNRALAQLGKDISIARRRRRMTAQDLADRVFTTRAPVSRIESGAPGVAVGTVFSALHMLGLSDRIADLADPAIDDVGTSLEIERLPKRIRRAPLRAHDE